MAVRIIDIGQDLAEDDLDGLPLRGRDHVIAGDRRTVQRDDVLGHDRVVADGQRRLDDAIIGAGVVRGKRQLPHQRGDGLSVGVGVKQEHQRVEIGAAGERCQWRAAVSDIGGLRADLAGGIPLRFDGEFIPGVGIGYDRKGQ